MNHLANLTLARAKWQDVPRENVDLAEWTCGAAHCFGGWVATWPEFYAMGVRSDEAYGRPTMHKDGYSYSGFTLSNLLFGSYDLFKHRMSAEIDDRSDWQVVMDRLTNELAKYENVDR